MSHRDGYDDGFDDGIAAAIIGGLAIYGAYKIVEKLRETPEQRLLNNLGRDLRQLDSGVYDGYDDEEDEDEDE